MTLRQFKRLRYGDRIRWAWRIYTVIEPFNRVNDALRVAWHGQTIIVSDPRWWVKLPAWGTNK